MAANNMKELERMIMKEMRKSMHVASEKMLADMCGETWDYYTKGNPKQYERTGTLGDTPKTTALTVSDKSVSFDAYLDTNYQYTTGDKPSMEQVLTLANYGKPWASYVRPTLGKKGFWERAEKEMEKTFNNTLGKFFTKT